MLVIRRTLADGRLTGLISGMGAATADAVYGFIAAFGLTAITSLLNDNASTLGLLGGLFLAYLGVKTLRTVPPDDSETTSDAVGNAGSQSMLASYATTFALTITNPVTILTFSSIFVAMSESMAAQSTLALMMIVLGVFLGSAVWWLTLSTGVSVLRSRFDRRMMLWVNRLSGTIILIFALIILFR